MLNLFFLSFAGALGTLTRYGIGAASSAMFGSGYPFGTFIVNILGSFLFGCLAGTVSDAHWRLILLTGFLGGFTTFSAFAHENTEMLLHRQYVFFAVHCLGQNILGVAAVLLGNFAALSLFRQNLG